VSRLRAEGRIALAGAMEHATPVSVSSSGEITLQLESTGEVFQQPLVANSSDVLAVIGSLLDGSTRLTVRLADRAPDDSPSSRRFTEEGVRRERLSMLRKKDATLDAAVEALDLELME